MSLYLARLISFLSSPIFIIIPIPFTLVYWATNNSLYALQWTIFSMGFLLLIGIFMLYSVKYKIFSDLDVSKREQRPLLFFFLTVISCIYLVSIYLLKGPSVLYIGMLGVLTAIFVVAIINTRIKASIHVATVTAVVLTLGLMYNIPAYAIVIIPIIAWARITTKRHTMQETVMGAAIGSLLILFMYIVVKFVLGK
jgi:hypothetical protein